MRARSSGASSTRARRRLGGGVRAGGGASAGHRPAARRPAEPWPRPRRWTGRRGREPPQASIWRARGLADDGVRLRPPPTVQPGQLGLRRPAVRLARSRPRTRRRRLAPRVESTPTRPPKARASRRTMARPRPAPPARAAPLSVWTNSSKTRSWASGARPGPVSLTVKRSRSRPRGTFTSFRREQDPADLGHLHRVAGEVEQDLPQAPVVGQDRRQRRTSAAQAISAPAA